MSRPTDNGPKSMPRIADLMSEDIMNASDDEVLSEFIEDGGDPEKLAAELRQLFDATALKLNKGKLAAAKAGAATNRQTFGLRSASNPTEARRRLRLILSRTGVPAELTLAARNESELSDADVLGILDDLKELGFLPEDDAS